MPSRFVDEEQVRRQAEYRYEFRSRPLAGRVVLVSGGTGGLGAAVTALLLQEGAMPVVGYRSNRNSYLYNVKAPDSGHVWGRTDLHTVEHQLALLKYLGFPATPVPPLEVTLTPEESKEARDRLRSIGVDGPFVLIHPAAAFSTK